MIGWRKIFAIISTTCFLILCILFHQNVFLYQERRFSDCDYDLACIQFCTNEGKSNDELFSLFAMSNNSDLQGDDIEIQNGGKVVLHRISEKGVPFNRTKIYKFIRAEPKCFSQEVQDAHLNFKYYPDIGGSVFANNDLIEEFLPEEYCYEHLDNTEWNIKICMFKFPLRKIVYAATTILSIFLIGIIICIYLRYKDLRDTYGKCLVCFLASILILICLAPIPRINRQRGKGGKLITEICGYGITVAICFSCFWYSIIWCQIYWRLKTFKNNISKEEDDKRFKYYALIFGVISIYLIGIVSAYKIIQLNLRDLVEISFILLYGILLISFIFCFTSSCYFMIKLSKSLQNSNKQKFEIEKFWFLSFLAVVPIIFIASCVEFFLVMVSGGLPEASTIEADCIKFLTVVIIFVIFMVRDEVKMLIFKDYKTVEPTSAV